MSRAFDLRSRSSSLRPSTRSSEAFELFEKLDGAHLWQEQMPEGYVGYSVRELGYGEVAYFNFSLAKEMGLVPQYFKNEMTKDLAERILRAFSLRIINEYDLQKKLKFDEKRVKGKKYMATRYLQLQHRDRRGNRSGDGRCIWNGQIRHRGKTWDVSSRGTGVTCLAPGFVEANRPLKSGGREFGYGCGMADMDELYSAAIMAEVFHSRGLKTERVLAIIDLGRGMGIGVRAAPNLFRPSHQFLYLKQGLYEPLERATDFVIQRQFENGEWDFHTRSAHKYDRMLRKVAASFAELSAFLERNFIFAWLDWDGDNCLASGGIIDYGSIRQFGLRHDQYRYDDVERFSTTLNEQVKKAKLMVQVYAQLVDFLKTKKKKPLKRFSRHPILREFDQKFKVAKQRVFLQQMGFNREVADLMMKTAPLKISALLKLHEKLESTKTKKRLVKVADGVNRPAILNMREALKDLPSAFRNSRKGLGATVYTPREFFDLVLVESASRSDRKLSQPMRRLIRSYLSQYKAVLKIGYEAVKGVRPQLTAKDYLRVLSERAEIENRSDRMTGNAVINIVDEILVARKQGANHVDIQSTIDYLIQNQGRTADRKGFSAPIDISKSSALKKLIMSIHEILHEHREEI